MSTSQYFQVPADARPEHFKVLPTDDVDLAIGELVKIVSNKPTAVSVDESADTIAGVVTRRFPREGNVTKVEIYFGPRLKMPIEASHHVPSFGDPVYCSSKAAVSADGAGVAATAAPIGRSLATSGSAGAGYVWIACHWPFWDTQAADAS